MRVQTQDGLPVFSIGHEQFNALAVTGLGKPLERREVGHHIAPMRLLLDVLAVRPGPPDFRVKPVLSRSGGSRK